MNRNYQKPAALLSVLILAAIAYSNSFGAPFVFDDLDKILYNSSIRSLSDIPLFFFRSDFYPLEKLEFRPVKYATIALNYALVGYRLWSYHLFNLLLHLANTLLVFYVVMRVAGTAGRDGKTAFGTAYAAAALFALHPLQTSTVMYMSNGRGVMLASLFYLLSFAAYMRFRDPGTGGVARYAWAVFSPVFYLLGLLSKEIAVTLPAVILLYDCLISPRKGGKPERPSAHLLYYASFAAVLVVFLAWKQHVHGYAVVRETPFAPLDYLLSEARAWLLYLRLIFLPFNQNADYSLPISKAVDMKAVLGFAVAALFICLAFLKRNKQPVAAFFASWFVFGMVPESTFISFRDIAVEYRLYLPLVGLTAAAATIALNSRFVRANTAIARGLFVTVLVIFTVLSFARNDVYATRAGFWRDAVAKSPQSPRAHANLGRAMLIEKDYPGAIEELKESLRIDPDYHQVAVVHFNLGMCYYETGDFENAALQFESAIENRIALVDVYNKLGESYFALGRYAESVKAFRQMFELGGQDPVAQYNLATALMMAGQDAEAMALMNNLLERGFDNFDVRYNLALLYQRGGKRELALREARAASASAQDLQSSSMADALIKELGG